jgi:hypothetical protein
MWGALWLVATASAGAVTWVAVSWAGPVAGSGVDRPLTPVGVRRALADMGPAVTTAPEVSITGTQRSSTHPSRQPGAAVKTHNWRVPGGSVSAACRSEHIQLLYASPASGWSYRLGQGSSRTLVIRFAGPSATSTFEAGCEHGTPVAVSTSSSQLDSSDSQRDD